MEEILSSIRRIIADEEAEEGKPEERAEAAEAEYEDDDETGGGDDDEDVLELTEVVREGGEVVDLNAEDEPAAQATAAPDEPAAEPEEVEEVELAPGPQETDEMPEEQTVSQEEPSAVPSKQAIADELLSDTAATAATGAFARLSSAMARTAPEESIAEGSGRTVEQFVEDMIRPMLKTWLDENLPPIVERLVQKEIQKIARRAELL